MRGNDTMTLTPYQNEIYVLQLILAAMIMRKTTLFLLCLFCFLTGVFIANSYYTYRDYVAYQKKLIKAQTPPAPKPAEKKEVPLPPQPELFFEVFNYNELVQFDRLYNERQTQLRDILALGSQAETLLVPKGIFAQMDIIESKLNFLNQVKTYTDSQSATKQLLLGAYQFLLETFHSEVEFLKAYPEEGQKMSFITQNIFDISAKDQRSGLQFLDCMINFRKLSAESIREDQNLEKNQSRVRDLVNLNALIEKYKILLNVPKEVL